MYASGSPNTNYKLITKQKRQNYWKKILELSLSLLSQKLKKCISILLRVIITRKKHLTVR